MTWVDLAFIAVISLSALLSLFRGFVKEVLSLVGWVLSFWFAAEYSYLVAEFFEDTIKPEDIRHAVGFLILFFSILIIFMVSNRFIVKYIRSTSFSGMDRSLGVAFGSFRGLVIVTIFVMLTGMTPMQDSKSWEGSIFAGYFEYIADWAVDTVPKDMMSTINQNIILK